MHLENLKTKSDAVVASYKVKKRVLGSGQPNM